jgi:hypothetical protein
LPGWLRPAQWRATPPPTFCTAIAQNFLPHARVLASSLREHNPGATLQVLFLDPPASDLADDEPFHKLDLYDLALPREEIDRRRTMYDSAGLASSLRGPLMATLLARRGGPVIFLDADMLIFGSLEDLGELAMRHAIVLTPH